MPGLDRVVLAACGAAAALYSFVSIARHRTFRSTGFDLGIFDQALWHYARLEAPASSIKGLPNLLGDHFSPILVLLAPVRWLGTEAVLVAQAVLVVAAALPIYWFARERADVRAARGVAVSYLLFGGVIEALWFDFHEVCFAPLLIAVAVWRRSVLAVLALLLVKEDLALLVSAFGVWFWLSGERRRGAVLAIAGVVAYVLITGPLMPGAYTYAGQYPGPVLEDLGTKARTLAYLLGAFAGLSLLSPLLVLALPLLAARFLGDNPKYWTLEDHYSLTIAPILALASVDGLRRFPRAWWIPPALAVVLAPAFLQIPASTPHAYRAARDALSVIPRDAPVTASNRLAAHLSARDEIRLPDRPPNRYVVIALEDATAAGLFPFASAAERDAWVGRLRGERLFERDGMLVLRLEP